MKQVLWIGKKQMDSETIKELNKCMNTQEFAITPLNPEFSLDGARAYQQFDDILFAHKYDMVGGEFPPQLWAMMAKIRPPHQKMFVVICSEEGNFVIPKLRFDHIELL